MIVSESQPVSVGNLKAALENAGASCSPGISATR